MNSSLHRLQSKAQIESTLRRAEERHPPSLSSRAGDDDVVVRLAGDGDGAAIARLSQLEGRALPPGAALVADHGGAVLAAVSVESGAAVADPFQPTAHLVDLLLRSRAHLRGDPGRRHRRRLAGLRRRLVLRRIG